MGIRLNVAHPEPLAAVEALLPPGARRIGNAKVEHLYSLFVAPAAPRPGIRRFHLLYANATRLARTTELAEALAVLESDLRLHIAAHARRRLFVHAGVVGYKGRAIVLPGRSYSGKSTLVAALVRAGATYYSDEYAVLDDHGRVHPFAQPLSLRQPDSAQTRKINAVDLGGKIGLRPLPLGVVVATRYREGVRFRPRRLSPGRAVLALLDNTVAARSHGARALRVLREAVTRGMALSGNRGEADQAVHALLAGIERNWGPVPIIQ